MRGKLSLFLVILELVQGFYTTIQMPYETIRFKYLQREGEDEHKKYKERGKGYQNTKAEEDIYIFNVREGGPGLFNWTDLLLLVSSMLFLFS
jgi:hypothetical protein